MMTEVRGFSNAKAKRETQELRSPSWRQGFKERAGVTRAEAQQRYDKVIDRFPA